MIEFVSCIDTVGSRVWRTQRANKHCEDIVKEWQVAYTRGLRSELLLFLTLPLFHSPLASPPSPFLVLDSPPRSL